MANPNYVCSETSDGNESISKFLHDGDESSATEIESPTKKRKSNGIKHEEIPKAGPSSGGADDNGVGAGVIAACDGLAEDGI